MPKLKPGQLQVNVLVDAARAVALQKLCETTGRTLPAELLVALDRHLDNPPRVIVTRHADMVSEKAEPQPAGRRRKPGKPKEKQ